MSQLPNNPNATSNRVPEGAESVSLRAMAAHKQRVVDQLVQEARVARATYEEVKRRYEVQYLSLQETQSELHVSKELAETLEKTAASLEAEVGQLSGLLHPLRRCPDDVWRLIFEETQVSFADAVTLSHVCQRWRALAISSPRLWSRIVLKLDLPDNAAESQVQAFLSRIKEVPATISLHFGSDEKMVDERLMTKVRIAAKTLQVSRVDHLHIQIEDPFEYSSILEALPIFPRHRLTSLDLEDATGQEEPQGPWTDFLSRFLSIPNLHLCSGSFGSHISQDLQSTFEVTLDSVDNLPLTGLLRSMPNVQLLEVSDCATTAALEGSTNRVALPSLRSLLIHEMTVPWEMIDCPLITKISLHDIGTLDNASFWAFLPSARMLTELRLNPSPSQLSILARVTPQIQDLHLTGIREEAVISVLVHWQRFGLDGPAFPTLRLLHLHLRRAGDYIDLEALDSLIHERCLSTGRPEAGMEATTPLDEFIIVSEVDMPPWNGSDDIAKYFNKSRKPDAFGDVSYRFVGGSKPQR